MDAKQIREFLLSSQEEIRDEHFKLTASAEAFETVDQVESELVDDYVLDLLSPSEKESFERNYLVTEARRRKVQLSRHLLVLAMLRNETGTGAPSNESKSGFPFRVGLAVAAAALVMLGLYLGVRQRSVDVIQPQEFEIAVQTPTAPEPTPSTAPSIQDSADAAKVSSRKFTPATITLSPSLLRSGGKEIVLSQEETRVPFLMKLQTKPGARTFSNYSVKIETPEGNAVTTSSTILRIAKTSVTFSVVGSFQKGTYIVYLVGVDSEGSEEPVEEYSFKVTAN